jgi:diguanylate cyclase (GGDEF)-like protein
MDKPQILIIDDDPNLRKTLSDILRIKGYETLTAEDGEKGLAVLREKRANLVLIDLGLPDIPGLEMLARIKADYPETGAIVLTGQASIDSAVEATNRGAFSYMVKPYEIDQLLNHIRRALEKQQAQEEIARHHIELLRMNAELKAFHDVSKAISKTLDMDELVEEVLQVLVRTKIFPFEVRGGIFLVDDGKLRLASFASLTETVLMPCQELRQGQCFCGSALTTGEIIVFRSSVENGVYALCHPETEQYGRIIVPLKAVDKVVGIISLYTEPGTEVSEGLMSLLRSLGSQIGIAVNNSRLYEETKSASLRDPLTGLANRRFLEIQLEKIFEQAKRYGQNQSVIMLDIDHFKNYNDSYGHQGGDLLLVALAKIIMAQMRKSDYVFRYGGEEFLVLLPDTGLPMARDAAQRLRAAVEREAGVTISLGVAIYRDGMPDKETLVKEADAALYRAKEGGRNRVEIANVVDEPGTWTAFRVALPAKENEI